MLRSLYPNFNNGKELAYSCLAICEALGDHTLHVEAWFPASDRSIRKPFLRNAWHHLTMPIVYRLPEPNRRLREAVQRAFLRALQPGDIAYIWPGISLETYKCVKERGNIIVSQRTNCHMRLAKRVLDAEHERLGLPNSCGISEDDVQRESEKMAYVDFVYAMSPFVHQSLLESGVPEKKILPTTSGWESGRMKGANRLLEKEEGLTVLFVGLLTVRKGIHLLLQAWERAGIKGRLLLAGIILPDAAEILSGHLSRPDVLHIGFQEDIGPVYRSADVFVCASLEEGGPKVTYEAMGCGLPVIVSPMGAGPARDGIDGFVLDPHDIDGWAAALQRFAGDAELLKRMGSTAKERAQEFTWEKVGRRRREVLQEAIAQAS